MTDNDRYINRHGQKAKYLLYSLYIANAIELEDWHKQKLKEKNVKKAKLEGQIYRPYRK